KLYSGEISPEEAYQLEEWYVSSAKNNSYTEHLSREEKDELENEILKKIELEIRIKEERERRNKAVEIANRASDFQWVKIAAAITAVFLFVVLTYHSSKPQYIKYATSYGEIIEVILPDSSKVTLNGNSTLTTATNWASNQSREVYLEGEAIFAVRKSQ